MGNRIAILGAGQLAKYLVQSAKRLGFEPTVVASKPNEPACSENCQVIAGDWKPELFLEVFKTHDLVTFENEWISDSLLTLVRQHGFLGKLYPSSQATHQVRTKWDQKQFFLKQKYPTSRAIGGGEWMSNNKQNVEELLSSFKLGTVFKESEMAYDGKGVFFFEVGERHRLDAQIEKTRAFNQAWYVEEKIAFDRELALVFTRSRNKEFAHFPLVQFESEQGICTSVFVEGDNQGLMATLEKQAVEIARDLSETLDWYGTAAIEFFFDDKRGLLVNEFAPRVHNSAHFSLSASETSQFENHIRAIGGMRLGSCRTAPFAMMKNLIGMRESVRAVPPINIGPVQSFWYGKEEIRPGRKMGHVNAFGALSERVKIENQVNQVVNDWQLSTMG